MKQHITVKQLNNELSKKGKKKFIKEFGAEFEQVSKSTKYGSSNVIIINPLLSIGQMIEFLDEKIEYKVIKSFVTNDLIFQLQFSIEKPYHDNSSKESLCDDLWKAVKKKLEK